MFRLLTAFILLALLLSVKTLMVSNNAKGYDESVCAGQPLATVEARETALEKGYNIDKRYDCIERQSFTEVNAQILAGEQREAQKISDERTQLTTAGASDFVRARHGFKTALAVHDEHPIALPIPPGNLFVRNDYKNPQNYMLPGFITPDPKDGQRHPAIIWLTGGDSNSLSDFWTPSAVENDQSASAFREAGLIMAFPTLRGGNDNKNAKEYFFGEVEDVLAVANKLSELSYVDPERIYLGGHSSGGTLALLVAETKTPFKSVFAFGPVTSVDKYPQSLVPVNFADYDPMELKLRSPIHWLESINQQTYIIEGVTGTGNGAELEALCEATDNPWLGCIRVQGADHFSVLYRATRIIANKIAANSPTGLSLKTAEFVQ